MVKNCLKLLLASLLSITLAAQTLAANSQQTEVTIFAAASLTNALQDIATQYKQQQHVNIVTSFASSSTLARQLEAGAPADLYISADQKWMDYAQKNHSIDEKTRKTLLSNSLVLIAPKNSAQSEITLDQQTDWSALLKDGRLAVGDPQHVPVGIYARQALEKLGAWQTVEPKLAPTQDVRSGLALVERNETPLGIVYSSDAQGSQKVKIIAHFPQDTYPKVEYPLAIIAGHDTPAVRAFYQYLQGPQAAVVFQRYGFITVQ